MIYRSTVDGITPNMLRGFFVGWPNPPSQETHLKLLKNSSHVVLALDDDTAQVVGFITSVSDNVLSAYIPFLEVLPEYKNKGVGKELVRRMLDKLNDLYMVDLCCDDELIPYYENFNMNHTNGMVIRNYANQSGKLKTLT